MEHFADEFIIVHNKKSLLKWNLSPVPTIYQTKNCTLPSPLPPSVLPTVSPARKPPTVRNTTQEDEIQRFTKEDICSSVNTFTEKHCPVGFTFSKQEDSSVVYFRMFFSNGIMKIKESFSISLDLKVTLSFEGIPIPLPEWLRIAKNCKITRISQLKNLPSYIQNKTEELPPNEILDEIKSLTFLKPQGRPPFSPRVLRYILLLRYSSRQAYSLLLNEFPLPSFSLLEKLSRGSLDALKVAKKFLDEGNISKDCMVLFDEMYLQKGTHYHGGKHVGADEDGNFFKGVVCFMIVGLQKSVPIVAKTVPETCVSGDLIVANLMDVITKLAKVGFNVRGVVCDDHSSNVNAYSKLFKSYGKKTVHTSSIIHHMKEC